MNREEIIRISQARAKMYRFLGGIYLMEVDAAQLHELQQIAFPFVSGNEDADMDLQEGYALLARYLQETKEADLEDLAADYAKVFLAAGEATGRAAFPYESVYVDKKRQVGGSTAMKMKTLYLARGYEPDPAMYRTMDDHIGLILQYMGILCDEMTKALSREDDEKAQSLLSEQKGFVKTHITNWVYSFTSDIIKFADLDFYRAIAKITNGFIKKETVLLKGGKLWDTV